MRPRNRIVLFLTMPLAIFLLLIGWTMMNLGIKQKPTATKTSEQKELTLTIIPSAQTILA